MDWTTIIYVCIAWLVGFLIGQYTMHRKGMVDMANHITNNYNVTPKARNNRDEH